MPTGPAGVQRPGVSVTQRVEYLRMVDEFTEDEQEIVIANALALFDGIESADQFITGTFEQFESGGVFIFDTGQKSVNRSIIKNYAEAVNRNADRELLSSTQNWIVKAINDGKIINERPLVKSEQLLRYHHNRPNFNDRQMNRVVESINRRFEEDDFPSIVGSEPFFGELQSISHDDGVIVVLVSDDQVGGGNISDMEILIKRGLLGVQNEIDRERLDQFELFTDEHQAVMDEITDRDLPQVTEVKIEAI